jgi:hypothetical protein
MLARGLRAQTNPAKINNLVLPTFVSSLSRNVEVVVYFEGISYPLLLPFDCLLYRLPL